MIKLLRDMLAVILESAWVQGFNRRYPAAYRFIAVRLSLNRFSGLPLTILVISICLNLLLLADFTEDVINSREFIALDNFIAQLLFNLRIEPVARGFYYFSQLCNLPMVAAIGGVFGVYLLLKKKFYYAAGILISLLGSGLSILLGKGVFEIDRPHQYAYYEEFYFSFPSGHATIAVAFYGLLFYFPIRRTRSVRQWVLTIGTAVAFCVLMGISRLYLCVHYLSDVLAGFLLGSLWLLLSISMIEWLEYKSTAGKAPL